jgi:SAM-dependent methyltransferase
MPSFSDHFSVAADRYAAFRPTYPTALYEWLATLVPPNVYVWDCGTGNGQAALALRAHFECVVATDPSESQLRQAPKRAGVHYAVALGEASALAGHSIGLATVAQALHWFDLPRFTAEVRRVVRPGGVLAAWSYGLFTVDPAIDEVVHQLNAGPVGRFWPPERALVDRGYSDIELPFAEISCPDIRMTAMWTLGQLTGYVHTWSAVSRYRTETGHDPIPDFVSELGRLWGAEGAQREVQWPLVVRAWAI